MRTGVTISTAGHAAALLWGVLTFAATPYKTDTLEAMPIDVISATEFSKMTSGARNAPQIETPKPLVEKLGERRPVNDATATVVPNKEIKAATEAPPLPVVKPAQVQPKEKKAEPKRDPIAEALKKDQPKKSESKKAETKKAEPKTPPKKAVVQQAPKFDPKQVEALLDKRNAQRLAATGDSINDVLARGTSAGAAVQLSQSALDALRSRLAQLWNPPAAANNPQELVVQIRMQLKPDGTLAAPPMVVNSGHSPMFIAARDSAVRAVIRGQPFDMLKPEFYEQWKDVEITFDPREMIRG
jgi:colicin import membrane protein